MQSPIDDSFTRVTQIVQELHPVERKCQRAWTAAREDLRCIYSVEPDVENKPGQQSQGIGEQFRCLLGKKAGRCLRWISDTCKRVSL
jgi:hypothetical protein